MITPPNKIYIVITEFDADVFQDEVNEALGNASNDHLEITVHYFVTMSGTKMAYTAIITEE